MEGNMGVSPWHRFLGRNAALVLKVSSFFNLSIHEIRYLIRTIEVINTQEVASKWNSVRPKLYWSYDQFYFDFFKFSSICEQILVSVWASPVKYIPKIKDFKQESLPPLRRAKSDIFTLQLWS